MPDLSGTDRQVHPGSIPPDQRRWALMAVVVIFLVIVGGCLIVNLLAGSPVDWFWLVTGGIFVTLLMAAWLWVRLSE